MPVDALPVCEGHGAPAVDEAASCWVTHSSPVGPARKRVHVTAQVSCPHENKTSSLPASSRSLQSTRCRGEGAHPRQWTAPPNLALSYSGLVLQQLSTHTKSRCAADVHGHRAYTHSPVEVKSHVFESYIHWVHYYYTPPYTYTHSLTLPPEPSGGNTATTSLVDVVAATETAAACLL